MNAVDARLVRRDDQLVQLLDPPFDRSTLDPGYIRGYVPGVRENGGQYTHGAIWSAMAFAAMGDRERAWELMTMINPVNHARTPTGVATYKAEPYVIAADVYALAPHTGRGGWSWYTGSAGWMYRLIVESLLGLTLDHGRLRFTPCLPADWTAFTMRYRYRDTAYDIAVRQAPAGAAGAVDPRDGGWRRPARRRGAPRRRSCDAPGPGRGSRARRIGARVGRSRTLRPVAHSRPARASGRGVRPAAPQCASAPTPRARASNLPSMAALGARRMDGGIGQ